MNDSEAIYCLKAESERHPELCEECNLYGQCGCDHCYEDASDIAIKALEEIQQYRAIGTVTECREAMKLYNSIRERAAELNKLRNGVRNRDGERSKGHYRKNVKGCFQVQETRMNHLILH